MNGTQMPAADDTIMATADDTIFAATTSAHYPDNGLGTVTNLWDNTIVYPWTTYPATCWRCNCTPCICTSTVNTILHVPAPTDKVRLSPAEMDTLRKAAAKDDDLRAVLQKLRGKIEVEVDFGP